MNIESIKLFNSRKKAQFKQNPIQAKVVNNFASKGFNDVVATEEQQEAKEYVTPFASNMAFKGGNVKSKALVALMALAATSLTSCIKVEQEVCVDLSEVIGQLQAMREDNANNNSVLAAKIDQMINLFMELISLQKDKNFNDEKFQKKVLENLDLLVELGTNSYRTAEETKDLINNILNSNMSIEEKIQALFGLVQNIDANVSKIVGYLRQQIAELEALRKENAIGNMILAKELGVAIEFLNKLVDLENQKALDDKAFQDKVLEYMDTFVAIGEQNNKTAEETKDIINQILNSNMSIEQKIEALMNIVKNIDANVADMKDILTQALAEIKKLNSTVSAMKDDNAAAFLELIRQGRLTYSMIRKLDNDMIAIAKIEFGKLDALINGVKKLDIDMNAQFNDVKDKLGENADQIINTMLELGYTQEQIMKMSTKQILNAIEKNTNELKKQTFVQNQIAMSLKYFLPILVQNGNITNAKLEQLYQAFIDAVNNGDSAKLDEIIAQLQQLNATASATYKEVVNIGNDIKSIKNEVKKARIDISNQLKSGNAKLDVLIGLQKVENGQNQILINQNNEMKKKLSIMIDILSNLDNKVYTIEELAFAMGDDVESIKNLLKQLNVKFDNQAISLDNLIGAVNATTQAVEDNTAATNTTNNLIGVVIGLIKDLPQVGPNVDLSKVEKQLGTIIEMLSNNGQQNADATKLLASWLEKIYNRMGVMVANQEKMDKNQQKGFQNVIAAINNIKLDSTGKVDLSSVVNAINNMKQAIVDLLGEGFNKNDANLKAILAKLDKLPSCGYDEATLMAELNAILEAIINHTCDCNCGGSQGGNHEGILGDLDNILALEIIDFSKPGDLPLFDNYDYLAYAAKARGEMIEKMPAFKNFA